MGGGGGGQLCKTAWTRNCINYKLLWTKVFILVITEKLSLKMGGSTKFAL